MSLLTACAVLVVAVLMLLLIEEAASSLAGINRELRRMNERAER